MRNARHSDRERVRIDFSRSLLKTASKMAQERGMSLSGFIENVLLEKTGETNGITTRGRVNS